MYRKKVTKIIWENAPDVKESLSLLKERGVFKWLDLEKIFCLRSYGSKSKAIARIWGLPKCWQITLNLKPCYILEVISEKYDRLGRSDKNDVLLHEIAHIPRNFSGSLIPHYRRGKRRFKDIVSNLKMRYHNQNEDNSSSR